MSSLFVGPHSSISLVSSASAGTVENSAKARQLAGQSGCAKIAIVEDEEDICKVLQVLVARLGYEVNMIAHDAEEALQLMENHEKRPDLILMDYRLPVMDGIQAARKILAMDSDAKIIITTADDRVRDSTRSEGLGFLQKPFTRSQLSSAIRESLLR